MEESRTYHKSREEKIREARESCHCSIDEKPYFKGRLPKEEIPPPAVKKGTLIRLFLAASLFLAMFSIKELDLKPDVPYVNMIRENLSKNQLADQWEDTAAAFLKEKVLPVFKSFP